MGERMLGELHLDVKSKALHVFVNVEQELIVSMLDGARIKTGCVFTFSPSFMARNLFKSLIPFLSLNIIFDITERTKYH